MIGGEVGADGGEHDRPGGIELFDEAAGVVAEIVDRVFVSNAPKQHTRVVFISGNSRAGAAVEDFLIRRIGEMLAAVDEGHLIEDVEAEFVAKIETAGMGRVVGGPHEIAVRVSDESEVATGVGVGGDAAFRPDFVVVDPSYFDRSPVEL